MKGVIRATDTMFVAFSEFLSTIISFSKHINDKNNLKNHDFVYSGLYIGSQNFARASRARMQNRILDTAALTSNAIEFKM